MPSKEYLGDSVYVNYDGYYVVLTTEDGTNIHDTIFLEPKVLQNLLDYYKKLQNM
jgi:hypothetical protein